MEAVEGSMVRCGTEERQADVPAHEQVTGKLPFKLAVRTGVGPGTDEFGKDQGANGEGRGCAGSGGMIVVAACSDNGRGVVEVSETDERMAGTLEEHSLIDEGTDPGEDQGEKAVEESLDDWREVRKVSVGVRGREW